MIANLSANTTSMIYSTIPSSDKAGFTEFNFHSNVVMLPVVAHLNFIYIIHVLLYLTFA